jgi:O-antigen ligase
MSSRSLIEAFPSGMLRALDWLTKIIGWEDNPFAGRRTWLGPLSALAVLLYAFLAVSAPKIAEIFLYVLILCSIGFFISVPSGVRRSAIFVLLFLAICVPLASWALSLWTHPELAEQSPKVNRVTNWMLPIVVAFALGGRTRNTLLVWGAALLGLLVSVGTGGGLATLLAGLSGQRVDFGLHNAQHTAMYFGVAFLGLVCFLPRLLAGQAPRWLVIPIWLALAAFAAAVVFISQTRAIWLGLALSLVLVAGMFAYSLPQRRWLVPISIIVIAGVLFLIGRSERVEQRINEEINTFAQAFRGQMENVPFDSAGVRLHSWREAANWIEQRPLLGWGGGGRGLVIERATSFPDHLRQFRHLHSSYLDTLVNYGACGLILLLALWGWLAASAVAAYRRGALPADMLQFLLIFMFFWATINLFESYVYFSSGTFVFALVAGGCLSHIWHRNRTFHSHPLLLGS